MLQIATEVVTINYVCGYTTVSLVEGFVNSKLWVAYLNLIVFCFLVHVRKQAYHLKSSMFIVKGVLCRF
jgi:hypothetical protein